MSIKKITFSNFNTKKKNYQLLFNYLTILRTTKIKFLNSSAFY